uniref:SXP/RAL-2 family protein Ani s 5-like cation-binding domain-containing protein n=1 Tax=Parascaris equorum TaxID=6256 RepID=A0A914RRH7_PAREQ
MNYALLFVFIASLLCYVTSVNAYRYGAPQFRLGFVGYPRAGNVRDEMSTLDPALRLTGKCLRLQTFRHSWVPDFLKNIASDGVDNFCDIVMNENLTKAEAEQELSQWAENQGGEVREQFDNYLEGERQKWNNLQQKMHELIGNVTHFFTEVENLRDDMTLTKREERQNVLCSRSYRPWQPWLPDFLKNISSEGVREFCNIATNENLTKADSEQQLEQWAQSQGVQ